MGNSILDKFKQNSHVKFWLEGIGEEEFHTVRFKEEIQELERKAELADAVEWAMKNGWLLGEGVYEPCMRGGEVDAEYVIDDRNLAQLLEAYRQSLIDRSV